MGHNHKKETSQEHDSLFYSLFNHMSSGVAIYKVCNDGSSGKDYIVMDFNQAALRMEKKEIMGVKGKSLFDLRPNIDEYGLIPVFQKVWMTGESSFFPTKLYEDENNYNWYENRVFKLPNGEIVAVYDDVTERMKLELQLKQNMDDLLASQRIAHLGTWRLDLATNQVVWSEELYKMYGFDPAAPPPPYTEHMKLFTAESWKKLSHSLEQTRITGIPYELVLETVTKDGSNGWMWVRGETIKDSGGNAAGLWGAAQDITTRIQSELALLKMNDELIANGEELEAMNEEIRASLENLETAHRDLAIAKKRAEDANAAKSQFLANMSHEIRTPMNGFMGMLQLLQLSGLTEEQQKFTQIAKRSADTLLVLVNDILDYSRIEAGKLELDRRNFNVHDMIHEVMALFSITADAAGLSMKAVIGKDIPPVIRGDSFRLKQIISNLVGNAVKFTHNGSIAIVVKEIKDIKELSNKNIKLEFIVKDTGIGIPPDKVDLLFQRFSQADSSTTRMHGGSGLGLSICKGLVEKMGGEIWVETLEGKGSSFYFTCVLEKAE